MLILLSALALILGFLFVFNYLLIDLDKSLRDYREGITRDYDKLVTAIDNELVVAGIGTFEAGDDPKIALNTLCVYWQNVGSYFANADRDMTTPS